MSLIYVLKTCRHSFLSLYGRSSDGPYGSKVCTNYSHLGKFMQVNQGVTCWQQDGVFLSVPRSWWLVTHSYFWGKLLPQESSRMSFISIIKFEASHFFYNSLSSYVFTFTGVQMVSCGSEFGGWWGSWTTCHLLLFQVTVCILVFSLPQHMRFKQELCFQFSISQGLLGLPLFMGLLQYIFGTLKSGLMADLLTCAIVQFRQYAIMHQSTNISCI